MEGNCEDQCISINYERKRDASTCMRRRHAFALAPVRQKDRRFLPRVREKHQAFALAHMLSEGTS